MLAVKKIRAIRLERAAWFQREDFLAFLNDTNQVTHPATWHTPGQPAGELSDVFTLFDEGEGPDQNQLPQDIWQEITQVAEQAGMEYGLVWIVPLEPFED